MANSLNIHIFLATWCQMSNLSNVYKFEVVKKSQDLIFNVEAIKKQKYPHADTQSKEVWLRDSFIWSV